MKESEKYPRTERIKTVRVERDRYAADCKLEQAITDLLVMKKNPFTLEIAARSIYEACDRVKELGKAETPAATVGRPGNMKPPEGYQAWTPDPWKSPEEIRVLIENELRDERKIL